VQLIGTHFVPVALNLYRIREAQDASGAFFRAVYKETAQYQGLWVVSPGGKVLSSHQEMNELSNAQGRWSKKVLADLEAGLKAFGPVKPRHASRVLSLPYRGTGSQPDGRVTLAVFDKWVIVKDLTREPDPNALGATSLDSIVLQADEWASLAPRTAVPGSSWIIPEATARKFYKLLSPTDTVFRDPKEVTSVRLRGRVERTENGTAYLTYEGGLAGTHHGTRNEAKEGKQCSSEATLLGGVGIWDVQARKLLSLMLVFDGRFRNYAPYDDPPTRFGAVVEWRQDPPPAGNRPAPIAAR
jgi:hypothetical protein